ncbi:hypothetical protein CYMTET_36165, partial [Cymbomonas tetramitiformis]
HLSVQLTEDGRPGGNGTAEVHLENVAFRHGVSADNGGALSIRGARVMLYNCEVSDNLATLAGGGIAVLSADLDALELAHTHLFRNVAETGGSVYVAAGAEAYLFGVWMYENKAVYGGAVYVDGTGTLVVDEESKVGPLNRGKYGGGGIFGGRGAYIRITGGSEVIGNEVNDTTLDHLMVHLDANHTRIGEGLGILGGGGILVAGHNEMLINQSCVVRENTVSLMRSDTYEAGGGGVAVGENSSLLVTHGSEVAENHVLGGGVGGGVLVGALGSTVKLTQGSRIHGNAADSGGGVGSVSAGGVRMEVTTGSHVTLNVALDRGGGLYAASLSTIHVAGGNISGNSAQFGGGLYMGSSGNVIVEQKAELGFNTAMMSGGGFWTGKLTVVQLTASAALRGNSAATEYGGGGCTDGENTLYLNTFTISSNAAGATPLTRLSLVYTNPPPLDLGLHLLSCPPRNCPKTFL